MAGIANKAVAAEQPGLMRAPEDSEILLLVRSLNRFAAHLRDGGRTDVLAHQFVFQSQALGELVEELAPGSFDRLKAARAAGRSGIPQPDPGGGA